MAEGYSPASDHVCQLTGKVGQCSRKGCKATWPIRCHGGRRKLCPACSRAVHRVKDREYQAYRRFVKRQETDHLDLHRLYDQADYDGLAAELAKAGYGGQETADLLADWVEWQAYEDDQDDS
jgi:hypothetical protein